MLLLLQHQKQTLDNFRKYNYWRKRLNGWVSKISETRVALLKALFGVHLAVFCHCVLIQDSYSKWASEQPPWVTWASFGPGGWSTLMNSPTNSKWGGRASSPKENQDRGNEQGNSKGELAKICFYYRTLLVWFWLITFSKQATDLAAFMSIYEILGRDTRWGNGGYSRGKQSLWRRDCQCQVVVNMMAIKKDREWNSFMEKGSFLDI